MSQWYLSKNGKALGPLSSKKIISLIREGEISHLDLVYQSGNAEWQPLSQVEEFSSALSQADEPISNENKSSVEWVLLKKVKGEKGSEYKQLGPYSKEQVLDLVDEGVIKFTDFAWKQGLETWVRIAELDEFSKPLPSSPEIDMSLYEKTSSGVDDVTLTDVNKASMTEMVKIERFDHQKDQMVAHESSVNEESEPGNIDKLDVKEVMTGPSDTEEVESVSKNSDFDDAESNSDFNVDLWSLEPPREKETPPKENKIDVTETVEGLVVQKHNEVVMKKKKPKQKMKAKEKKTPKIDGVEKWQWGAAAVAFIFSIVFVTLSLTSGDKVEYEVPTDPQVIAQIAQQKKLAAIELREQQMQRERVAPSPDPRAVEKGMEDIKRKLENAKKAVPDDENEDLFKEEKIVSKEKVNKKEIDLKKISLARSAVKKKRAPTKTKVQVKKTVIAQSPPKSKKRRTRLGTLVTGSSKMKSYYKQRDRKALFYSSLRAETLAIDVQTQYRKIGKNRKKWSKYYRGWKKNVARSLAKEIRNYPQKSQVYAYPKQLQSFKMDFNDLYKFGELFNAKVRGVRVPSNSPKEMRRVFGKHKKLALSLGR